MILASIEKYKKYWHTHAQISEIWALPEFDAISTIILGVMTDCPKLGHAIFFDRPPSWELDTMIEGGGHH